MLRHEPVNSFPKSQASPLVQNHKFINFNQITYFIASSIQKSINITSGLHLQSVIKHHETVSIACLQINRSHQFTQKNLLLSFSLLSIADH